MNNPYQRFLGNLKGKRVMVLGLGKSNEHIIKMFFKVGAKLIVCDAKSKAQLPAETLDYIEKNKIEHRLGLEYTESLDCDIIIRTPGMNFYSDFITKARKRGVVVTSEMEIFFDFCPCRIIGITGSDGKSTVTTIIYEMLKNAGLKVFRGGNIGVPLLPYINEIGPNDIAVVELSSFQLISMRKSPYIAVITNISPNHLDVHKNMEEYINAKKNIFLHQNAFSKAILNYDNFHTKSFENETRGKVIFFSRKEKLKKNGVWVKENGDIVFSWGLKDTFIINKKDIKLKGEHNLENYLAAIGAVYGMADIKSIEKTAKEFCGVEHRMEMVKTVKGATYYNDSIATSPTRVILGCLSLFKEKIILIAGGYDKNIPFGEFGDFINKKVKILILMGQTANKIEEAVKTSDFYKKNMIEILKVENMNQAVQFAYKNAKVNDVVALSPGCASFGMYKNFEERGNDFKKIVNSLGAE